MSSLVPKSLSRYCQQQIKPFAGTIRLVVCIVLSVGILRVLHGCIQPFSPPEINSNASYLVVDGFFNVSATDSSRFELRWTQNVNHVTQPPIETGAVVLVEQEEGQSYAFTEQTKGVYVLPPATYDLSRKYRLRIKTRGGKEYLSEYVAVSRTPEIDSVTYKLNAAGNAMVFYVNTHDAQNRTQFYRWKFEETWEYAATYYSALKVENEKVVIRDENINRCWSNQKSGSILLGSTVRLSEDIIKDLPLNIVPISTNKLYVKYSILVKQYGLSQPAFEYWTSLAKTTQGTGSLFDPLPSQVTGNITNMADSRDLAFGYFSASTEATKRIVITPKLGSFPRCTEPDTLPIACNGRGDVNCGLNTPDMLLSYWGVRADSVLVATASCTDCRLSGGTTQRPPFF
ncbi:DUF4249 domain-containing protein [Dyadobacter sp.]|uniref:DUF4249 domain-containing protein n=1 Tax=Dyadobacter sp. TaxID=1914288 RepID=UPI003F6FA0CF